MAKARAKKKSTRAGVSRASKKTSTKGRKKAKGAKSSASSRRSAPQAATKAAGSVLRYLVIEVDGVMRATTAAALTPRIRADAKEGRVAVIDCKRVLLMTPKGAWTVIGDGYSFRSNTDPRVTEAPVTAEAAIQPALPAPEPVAAAVEEGVIEIEVAHEDDDEIDDEDEDVHEDEGPGRGDVAESAEAHA